MSDIVNHLDLFTGIGGFHLAGEWVWGKDFNTICHVEIDSFCQKVLKKHWPDVPIISDIKEYKHDGTAIDLLTGGFPCQPFSCAGKQRGKEDDRYLWPEMLRVISEIHPTYIIGENVAGIIKMGLDQVLSDLENTGYACQPFIIPACAVNAPHRRDRVWIVAHASSTGTRYKSGEITNEERRSSKNRRKSVRQNNRQISTSRTQSTDSDASDTSIRRLPKQGLRYENEQPPQYAQRNGEICQDAPDTERIYVEGCERGQGEVQSWGSNQWQESWLEVATRLCRVDDGIPSRMDRLKSLGNAIVPQVVVPIMQAIKELQLNA